MNSAIDEPYNRITLQFHKEILEHEFLEWIFLSNKKRILQAHYLGVLMYASFFLVDYFLLGEFNLLAFMIRVVMMPVVLACTGSLLYFGKITRQSQVDGLGILVMIFAIGGHFALPVFIDGLGPEYMLIMAAITNIYAILLCGIQFRVAALISLVTLVVYYFLELSVGSPLPGEQVFHLIIMTFFIIAELYAGYTTELSRRQHYQQLFYLEKQRKDLLFKNKELEQFAYIASHDLQEPLRTVTSFTELLDEDHRAELSDEGPIYLDFIMKATSRMHKLVKGLLDYSRLGKELEWAEVEVAHTLTEIREDLALTFKESNATLTSGELPTLKCYETEFRVLLQNLLKNAIKFTAPNQTPQVHIAAEKKEGAWEFSVKDNGIGIEKSQQEKIFMIFQRLHRQDEYEGTGIGLAHCRKIVELHGGQIWVESAPGKGSTFKFTIPIV